MRNKKLEFQPPAGNAPVTRISHIDWYAGPWDSIEHANQMVPDLLKEVGRRFDIYKDSNKKEILPYYWGKNKVGNFIAISMDNQTGTKVVSIGDIIISDDSVIVELGPDNTISVMFDWITYSLDDSVQLSITPVSQDKIKVIVVYALPTEQLIYVAEGQEGTETVEPDIPEGALFIRRGIATSEGIEFDPEVDLIEYKKKIEDNWLVVPFTSPTDSLPFTIQMIDERTNFYMTGGDGTGEAILKGIRILGVNRDLDFKIYNAGSEQITINSSVSFKAIKGFSTFTTPLIIKPYTVAELKYSSNDNIIHIMKKAEAGDGKNVTNSSNTTNGSHTQTQRVGDTWAWDTQGQPYSIKNLPDKSADASFNSMLAINATGQIANSNGVQMLLNASNAMTDAQVDILRENLKKTGESYSTGQPRIDIISPPVIDATKNYVTPVTLLGLNMFLNLYSTTAMVRMIRVRDRDNVSVSDSWINVSDAITVHQTLPNLLSVNINFYNYPQGYYKFEVTHNNLVSTSSAEVLITDTINASVPNDLILSDQIGIGATLSGKRIDIVGAEGSQNGVSTTEMFKLSDFGNNVILKASINWGETNKSNGSFGASASVYTSFGLGMSGQPASTTPSMVAGVRVRFFCNYNSSWVELTSINNTVISDKTTSNSSTDVYFIFNRGLVTLFIPQFSYSESKNYTMVDGLSLYVGQFTDNTYYGTTCGILLSQIIDI